MFNRSTQGSQHISTFSGNGRPWPASETEPLGRFNGGIVQGAGSGVSEGPSLYQATPGPAHLSSQTHNSTVPSAVGANLEPPFKWQHTLQQQTMNNPAILHEAVPDITLQHDGASGPLVISQSLLNGSQQQHEQLHASSVPAAIAVGTRLYGKWKIEPAPTNPTSNTHDAGYCTAAAVDGRSTHDHLRMVHLQQQGVAQQAPEQQLLLAAQAQHQQQLHQAALTRSAEAAAASLASSRSLYSYYSAITEQNGCQDPTAASYSLSSQRPAENVAVPTGLPPHPATSSYQPSGSGWSDRSTATSSASAARTAMINMYMQQRLSFEQHRNLSAGTGTAASAKAGMWNRQYSIIEQTGTVAVGRAPSDTYTAAMGLMCEEDLLSMEIAETQQQLTRAAPTAFAPHPSPQMFSAYVGDSVSINNFASDFSTGFEDDVNMEEDHNQPSVHLCKPNFVLFPPAAETTSTRGLPSAGAAAEDAASARQSLVLQMLSRTADMRKGAPVLTAPAQRAAAAGSESVRPRLLISEVSVYTERGAHSQMALNQANKLLSKMTLPDDISYMPISPESFLFKAGAAWQFPAFVICLGSSYLQRMFARLPQLAEAVMACPGFEDYCQYLPERYHSLVPRRLYGPEVSATVATLRSVQFTCLYLATKVADQVHAQGLLRFMLTNLSHNGAYVDLQEASDVEARCLDALEWRLGPFYVEDELSSEDEELWAGSMGHWDYGAERDAYPETFA